MLRELVQIAAMCYRAAEDLGLLEVEMTQRETSLEIDSSEPVIACVRKCTWPGDPKIEPEAEKRNLS